LGFISPNKTGVYHRINHYFLLRRMRN